MTLIQHIAIFATVFLGTLTLMACIKAHNEGFDDDGAKALTVLLFCLSLAVTFIFK